MRETIFWITVSTPVAGVLLMAAVVGVLRATFAYEDDKAEGEGA